jgi:copper transport protein
LADGLYTVAWRNVSSADGHRVAGSFPFVIGAASAAAPAATVIPVELAPRDIVSRWLNFVGLALLVGGVGYIVFVWRPAMRNESPSTPRSLWIMVWIGWLLAGIGGVLLLLNQTAILLNEPMASVLDLEKVVDVLGTTRFGSYWLWRMALWAVMGVLLIVVGRSPWLAWLATACGLLMLRPTSLHSHAAASNDEVISIFSDWVHLAMSSLWVGGLVQFLVALPIVIALLSPVAPKVGRLTAYFSNYARVAVAGLIITGIYATWLQVNTIVALTTTLYGQLLIIKLVLALALLLVAAVKHPLGGWRHDGNEPGSQ